MRQMIKIPLVVFLLSALAACNLPNDTAVPLSTPASPTAVSPTALSTASVEAAPLPTMAVPSVFGDWLTYTNYNYRFQFKYPPDGQVTDSTDVSARIQLPFVQDTNLAEKFVDVSMADNVDPCTSPNSQGYAPGSLLMQQVTINGQLFNLESGSDAGAGNIYDWTAYSTVKGTACVSLSFVLHSSNPGMYSTPPAIFDSNAESAVFAEIVSTFAWLDP